MPDPRQLGRGTGGKRKYFCVNAVVVSSENREFSTKEAALRERAQWGAASCFVFLWRGFAVPQMRHGLGVRALFVFTGDTNAKRSTMKFIFGLLIGAGLVFGWYSMDGASKAKLNQEREKAKAALEEVKKADAETLAAEKTKIRADYEVQLKAAEDQVQSLNTELLKIRTDLVTAQAKLTNMVETVKVVEKPASKPVVVTAPVAPVPQTVSAPPTVAQPEPTQPAQSAPAPVKSSFGGPRPAGRVSFSDGNGRHYRIVNGRREYY